MEIVNVKASSRYSVIIGKGLLTSLGEYVKKSAGICKVCIVTDDIVDALYSKAAADSLKSAGYECEKFVIPNGEKSKNTTNLVAILEFLAEKHFTRSDVIVTLGGGVVGDLGGFASGIYLRGIRYIQAPTTLLAAVDSSVGGKTAVDLVAGKNLAGVFHQPSLVICDTATLKTLKHETFADGCAEIVKYAIINDRAMFERLQNDISNNIESVISGCVKHKAQIVSEDEFDNGARRLLNLGHTVGHAIELCSNFKISHGSAVAIGTVVVMKAAVSLEICPGGDLLKTVSLLSSLGLPTECPYPADRLARAASSDKKRAGSKITLIVPYGIGNCKPMEINVEKLESFIRRGL